MIDFIDFIAANAGMIGLMFFFIFFGFVTLWTFRPNAKKYYDRQALIPLEENNND